MKRFAKLTVAGRSSKVHILNLDIIKHYGAGLFKLVLSMFTLSKVSFSDLLANNYWDHPDTFEKILIFTLSKITLLKVSK